MLDRGFSSVGKVLKLQVLIIILVYISLAVLENWFYAVWSLVGGLTAFVPNFYFALRIKNSEGKEPDKIVKAFYRGESGKLLLTVVMFAIIFQLPNIKLLPLMIGYVSALSVFWFALILRNQI